MSVKNLPPGLVLDGTALVGTPTASGSYLVRYRVEDEDGAVTDGALLLPVSGLFAADADPLPPATLGAPYKHRVGVRGPAGSYRWRAPKTRSLTVDVDGTVTGAPTASGMVLVPATIEAGDGRSRAVDLRLPVNPPPVITASGAVVLHTGEAVTRPLTASDGVPPYRWSVAAGALPKGVRLDADGVLRGATSETGTFPLTAMLKDRWGASAQAEVSIEVKPRDKDQQGLDQPQQQDQQPQDQPQQSDQNKQDQSKQDQGKQGESQPGQQEQQQPSGASATASQVDAERVEGAAAERFLDNLPAEQKDALRYQLLDGGSRKPGSGQQPW